MAAAVEILFGNLKSRPDCRSLLPRRHVPSSEREPALSTLQNYNAKISFFSAIFSSPVVMAVAVEIRFEI